MGEGKFPEGAKEGDVVFGKYEGGGGDEVVQDVSFAAGVAWGVKAPYEEQVDFEALGIDNLESFDVCVIGFKTNDGTKHEFTLPVDPAVDLATSLNDWLTTLMRAKGLIDDD